MEYKKIKEVAADMYRRLERGPQVELPKREECRTDKEFENALKNHELNKETWYRSTDTFLRYTLKFLKLEDREKIIKNAGVN